MERITRHTRVLIAAAVTSAVLAGCGGTNDEESSTPGETPIHVHGLGVNPADGAVFIATHEGVFRSAQGSERAERVGDELQDTMGFTVVGPDRFLASGHPPPGDAGPPHLGLIESTDGGQSWREVSLAGEADFHVLRSAADRIYAYNGLTGALMLSADGGRTWAERRPPAPMIDLAVDPSDPERIVASTERGLALSQDDGRSWRPLAGEVGLLAWPDEGALYLVDARGGVHVSREGDGRWSQVGNIDAQPAAFTAVTRRRLLAALGDGTILESVDAGASWDSRSTP